MASVSDPDPEPDPDPDSSESGSETLIMAHEESSELRL